MVLVSEPVRGRSRATELHCFSINSRHGPCTTQYHIHPVMVARRRLTDQERHLAVARIRTGSTQCIVAGELGVSQSVISRLVHRFIDTGSVGERPRSGAPRGTTRNDDQYLRTYALRNRDLTALVLQSRLREVRGTRMSRQTIRNRLHHFGLRARRPLQVAPLTDRHRLFVCSGHATT